ncbi:uncharacterized protein K452DRAFT_353671 [Aplosporella prunicola CBS 121167]|uniref:GED domain-containing protein n=1 Tax=Aplosporella prunicola CBS 121167 TaxID=1176127 RepID=A0A6A6B0W0_9PEZI|nr:uncharacterized protein K452DRAFT_353671 [Aplosporella prunicola CBS 121167]KAF2137063.1 hypothetical protein K452DRAFT_353671 [Aplosporella prunicola CBS 121167]
MSENAIHSLADPSMLEQIDHLFACNVGHHIDLPQIVVVGDQSSGKSSVLEGLTRLPFPRDSALCTRFATQIIFRRAPVQSVSVSIVPGKGSSDNHVETLKAWKRDDIETLEKDVFAEVMDEAHEVMGISRGLQPLRTFSSDVLRIEVTGPEKEHFSVIDVPGIFQNTGKGNVTKEDIIFVRNMVGGYMKNSRSIMLTVVPANADPANQSILQMAEDVDKEGRRTLGVLTKPDLVDKGAEQNVIDMVLNRSHVLRYGWFMVKNPGQSDLRTPNFDRYMAEKIFFETEERWRGLSSDRCGVDALRDRLQELLAIHIQQEFPKVKSEVNKSLRRCRKNLDALGPRRDTPMEQSRFLIDMATRFQEVTSKALDAKYVDDCFTKHSALKVATLVANRNEAFSTEFEKHGHTYQFKENWSEEKQEDSDVDDNDEDEEEKTEDEESEDEEDEDEEDDTIDFGHSGSSDGERVMVKRTNATRRGLSAQHISNYADELEDILYSKKYLPHPRRKGVLRWLNNIYINSRGFELGQFDPSLLANTMKEQSKSWDHLSYRYISDVVETTHDYINTLLQIVCPDEGICQRIKSAIMDGLMERYQRAFDQVKFILHVERLGTPATQNHYFNDNLQKFRQDRNRKAAEGKSFKPWEDGEAVVYLSDITQTQSMSNKAHTVQELHDILKSYYKVARKRVVDTLCMQAVTYHLISGPDTPLRLFSPNFVSRLSAEKLDEITRENSLVKHRRAQLLKEAEDLEKGKMILSR